MSKAQKYIDDFKVFCRNNRLRLREAGDGLPIARAIGKFKEDQFDKLVLSFDWDREIKTSDSNYYKWTQWIFLKLYNSYYDKKLNNKFLLNNNHY